MTAPVTIPMYRARDTGESIIEESTPEEQGLAVLERHFPRLVNDCIMLAQRPIRFHWDPLQETASTDCLAEIRLSPRFFLEGLISIGYGSAYHECGHILHSAYGAELLQNADTQGGPILKHIVNLLLDRKDDMLTAACAPGFAETVRNRLSYICTMTRRENIRDALARLDELRKRRRNIPLRIAELRKKHRRVPKEEDGNDEECVTRILKRWKPQDPYEDFFFTAKWHKRPRTRQAARAMKYLGSRRLLSASPAEILWIAERVRRILGKPSQRDTDHAEQQFITLCHAAAASVREPDKTLDPKLAKALKRMVAQYVGTVRTGGIQRLLKYLKGTSMIHAGPISTGRKERVPVKNIKQKGAYAETYQRYLAEVRPLVEPLTRTLRRLDSPSEFTLYGQDDGELDLSESARIATGLPGCYQETIIERDIDAEIHLAIDCSGSMSGSKVKQAKLIATVFTEAMRSLGNQVVGRMWAFSSEAIYDYGLVSNTSGFVTAEGEGGNSDTHMLRHVGGVLGKSCKRRKMLLVLADDGPDDMEGAGRLSQQLLARGIITAHLLVDVHGTPDIYPFELIYTSMEECLDEFGTLLETIIKHLK